MMLPALLFDLDGTLLDTLADLTESVNVTLAAFGFATRTTTEVRSFVGNGVELLLRRALPADAAIADARFAELFAAFRVHYEAHMAEKTAPYPGVCELLKTLSAAGYPLAVVSNKFDKAVKSLCRRFFAPAIQVAVGESAQVLKKPAPDLPLAALEALKRDPKHAIYIGDSAVDIATARAANLPIISVTWGFQDRETLLQNGARILADSPEELLDEIKNASHS